MRLAELAIFSDDVAAAARFYERLFGAPPVRRGEGLALFRVGGVDVLIHERCQPVAGDPPCENHVAFAVIDVDRTAQELIDRGLSLELPPRDYEWGRSAYLRDPDGNLLELDQQQVGG